MGTHSIPAASTNFLSSEERHLSNGFSVCTRVRMDGSGLPRPRSAGETDAPAGESGA